MKGLYFDASVGIGVERCNNAGRILPHTSHISRVPTILFLVKAFSAVAVFNYDLPRAL